MQILVIGGGGREHALVWKLRQSPAVTKLWCAPGNGGIAQQAQCLPADTADVVGLRHLAEQLGADLTVVGPEQPLVAGIADEFAAHGLRLVGPSQQCAQLEGSKVFTKNFLQRHRIPTPRVYGVFDRGDDARLALKSVTWPVVLKADGLCAGKGVLVASSPEEANVFIGRTLEMREFGDGGGRLLIEQAVVGTELSYIVLTDGTHVAPMVPARDHKRALDGDKGPNTGGMGAYSSSGIVSRQLEQQILDVLVNPTIAALTSEGLGYRGFLYFGLMLTPDGPQVLEFNCRLGDPEAQALVRRMDFDLAEVLSATVEGQLEPATMLWKTDASICVVMASGGYPGNFAPGKAISGLPEACSLPQVAVFHSGTRSESDIYYTCSGRVLGVTAAATNLEDARLSAYKAVQSIHFAGAHFRSDIGAELRARSITAERG
jgi:phosphoribosylamine---glycine ligase